MTVDRDHFSIQARATRSAGSYRSSAQDASSHASDGTVSASQINDVMRSIGEAVYFWDISADRLEWSGKAAEILNLPESALTSNRSFGLHLDPENMTNRFDTIMGSSSCDQGSGVPYEIEYKINVSGGTSVWVEDIGRWYADGGRKPVRAHGAIRVITERHEREQRLAYLSRFDSQTGLANRPHILEILEEATSNAKRYQQAGAFLIAAIDHLGELNATFGFDVADQVIEETARRVKRQLRTGDSIGRFSGNKFAIILNNCSDQEVEIAARRLRQIVSEKVVLTAAGPVSVTLSVGSVVFPRVANSVPKVVVCAQEALDLAKDRGVNEFCNFHHSNERETTRKTNLKMAEIIVRALNERTLMLAFQPIVQAETGHVDFHEALLRLKMPDGKIEMASHLIAPAERFRLTPLVDRRVLELAIEQLEREPSFSMSINVSASTAKDMDWIVAFMNAAKTVPDLSNRLIVEITETAMIDDMTAIRAFIDKIHEVGCRVAIDDFGAGYTSFRNLRALDIDMVKIDGSFIRGIHQSGDDQIFVKALVGIAKALDIKTVAEWVEERADADFCAALGIDYIQGFWYGKPDVSGASGDPTLNPSEDRLIA